MAEELRLVLVYQLLNEKEERKKDGYCLGIYACYRIGRGNHVFGPYSFASQIKSVLKKIVTLINSIPVCL